MNWRLTTGVVLLIAAIVSGWSAWRNRERPAPPAAGADRSDYVMYDFEVVALDKLGKESVTLRAPEMHRNPADQSFSITTPLFLLPDKQGHYWQMRSKTGWMSPDHSELRLLTDVQGTSPREAATPTTFRTERLNVFPNKNLASTDLAVTITRPGSILSGIGFETDLKTKAYVFKSQVRSVYVPKSAP